MDVLLNCRPKAPVLWGLTIKSVKILFIGADYTGSGCRREMPGARDARISQLLTWLAHIDAEAWKKRNVRGLTGGKGNGK